MLDHPSHHLIRTLLGVVVAVAATGLLAVADASAAAPGLPGMCNGRSDPNVVVNAHANGTPKYIVNLSTDPAGHPTGVLILGKGRDRLYVEQFCRLWQHLPGQEPGHGGEADEPDGATIVHAVGIGTLRDGTQVLVRTDLRGADHGSFFRVRYQPMGGGHDNAGDEPAVVDDGHDHDDEGWIRVPAEGWLALDRLKVRVVGG